MKRAIYFPGPMYSDGVMRTEDGHVAREGEVNKALYLPGPSYFDRNVKKVAGWWQILEYQRQAIELAGYEVKVAQPVIGIYQESTPIEKYISYCLPYVKEALSLDEGDLIIGAPAYGFLPLIGQSRAMKVAYVWNNAAWWRRQQLAEEYAYWKREYPEDMTSEMINTEAMRASDLVIACSPWVKKTHDEIGLVTPVGIAPWGVDSELFHPDWDTWPSSQGEAAGPLRLLFVGGDPVRKGLPYLIGALGELDGVELTIVGCSPEFTAESIKNKVRVIGMVEWEQMPAIMRWQQAICVPTLEDGICCAIQEGMASGLVPITSPDAGEVFEHRREGFVTGFRDINGIKSAISLLRDNPAKRREMAVAARQKATEQTWDYFKKEFALLLKGRN